MSKQEDSRKTVETSHPDPTADSLTTGLTEGKAIFDSFRGKIMEEYQIDGKTLPEWRETFKISIPPDLDPNRCKLIDVKLLELYEEATRHKVMADAVFTALLEGKANDHQLRMEALVSDYRTRNKKDPPASMLDKFKMLAENTTMRSTLANARIAKDFFGNILDYLGNCRKIVENASVANGTLAKLTQSAY